MHIMYRSWAFHVDARARLGNVSYEIRRRFYRPRLTIHPGLLFFHGNRPEFQRSS
jgi:hypothetical protein